MPGLGKVRSCTAPTLARAQAQLDEGALALPYLSKIDGQALAGALRLMGSALWRSRPQNAFTEPLRLIATSVLTSPVCGPQAGKAAFASKRRCVRDLSRFQCRLNLCEPHSPAAFRADQAGYRRVRWLGWYQNAKPLLGFLIQPPNALAQLVASRQHHPATLQSEVFCFFDLGGGINCSRPALSRPFVAICDLA
jgi:hypothetical protein